MIAMMFSDDRKYTLSGWFQVHERKLYNRPYQLQIFLILYEFFSEIENDESDLNFSSWSKKKDQFLGLYGRTMEKFVIDFIFLLNITMKRKSLM